MQSLRASHPVNLKINCFPGIPLGFESNQSWLYYYFLVRKYFYFLHLLILPFTSFTPVVCNFYIVRSSSVKVPLFYEFYVLSVSSGSLLLDLFEICFH